MTDVAVDLSAPVYASGAAPRGVGPAVQVQVVALTLEQEVLAAHSHATSVDEASSVLATAATAPREIHEAKACPWGGAGS